MLCGAVCGGRGYVSDRSTSVEVDDRWVVMAYAGGDVCAGQIWWMRFVGRLWWWHMFTLMESCTFLHTFTFCASSSVNLHFYKCLSHSARWNRWKLILQEIDTRTVCNILRWRQSLSQIETFKNCYLLVLLLLPGYWEKKTRHWIKETLTTKEKGNKSH